MQNELQLNPALTDFRGLTNFICYRRNSVIAVIGNKRKLVEGTKNVKKSQDHVKILGFHRPSHTRPILTPGIQICSQKWSQVNISIGYSYISQVKILYKVKFSKLEICQSDCRFKILAKNCVKKVSFFSQNFD